MVHITGKGAPEQRYVRRLTVDGKPVTNWWITWPQLRAANTVDFDLSSQEQRATGEVPPSYPASTSTQAQ